jgi:hypothetical protein
MLIAQSLGEYGGGGGGIASGLATSVQNGARWLELSLREDRNWWIAAVVGVVLLLVMTRRR